jgi:hypothetical protein
MRHSPYSFLVNIGARHSLAMSAAHKVPVVFDDPEKVKRKGLYENRSLLDGLAQVVTASNASQRHPDSVAASARDASHRIWCAPHGLAT